MLANTAMSASTSASSLSRAMICSAGLPTVAAATIPRRPQTARTYDSRPELPRNDVEDKIAVPPACGASEAAVGAVGAACSTVSNDLLALWPKLRVVRLPS